MGQKYPKNPVVRIVGMERPTGSPDRWYGTTQESIQPIQVEGGDGMTEIARQLGRTVRAAMQSWPATIRLCVLLAVATAAWAGYHLWVR